MKSLTEVFRHMKDNHLLHARELLLFLTIEFVTILLLFYVVLVFWPQDIWDLSSTTRDQTLTPCIGRRSPNHWSVPTLVNFYPSGLSGRKGGTQEQAGCFSIYIYIFFFFFSPFKLINHSFLPVSTDQVQHKALLTKRSIKHI